MKTVFMTLIMTMNFKTISDPWTMANSSQCTLRQELGVRTLQPPLSNLTYEEELKEMMVDPHVTEWERDMLYAKHHPFTMAPNQPQTPAIAPSITRSPPQLELISQVEPTHC